MHVFKSYVDCRQVHARSNYGVGNASASRKIGNTRRVFLMTPPKTVDELNKAITSSIFKMHSSTFGILDENDVGEYHESIECLPFSQIIRVE